MPDMITLYAPEKPPEPHECAVGVHVALKPPTTLSGTVIECKTCGQLWYSKVEFKPAGTGAIWSIWWYKVRWYHFELKKKARENG